MSIRLDTLNQLEEAYNHRLNELALSTYAAAGAAVIIWKESRRIYDKYLKAAVKCAGAEDKSECMRSYKLQALKAQKKHILSGRVKCDDTDCFSFLDNKIAQLDSGIHKLT